MILIQLSQYSSPRMPAHFFDITIICVIPLQRCPADCCYTRRFHERLVKMRDQRPAQRREHITFPKYICATEYLLLDIHSGSLSLRNILKSHPMISHEFLLLRPQVLDEEMQVRKARDEALEIYVKKTNESGWWFGTCSPIFSNYFAIHCE